MGRGRLRRGYSLEVIFEEDPDFCSHLDSLDSVAIRFGVKEADDTISVDSLVEEYQIRFQAKADKEQVFRSLDGIWDIKDMDTCFVEWDEFSPESISKMPPGTESFQSKGTLLGEIPQGGKQRSRVSRRQIVEASWVFDSSDESSNNDTDTSDTKEIETEIIEPVLVPKPAPPTLDVFPRPFPIDVRTGDSNCENDMSPPPAMFGNLCRIVDGAEKDTLESYVSTRTDETETNAYNFADPFNDSSSVASTTYESSASTTSSSGSVSSVCTVNNRSDPSTPKSSNSNSPPGDRFGSKYRSNLNVELQSRFQKLNSSSCGGVNRESCSSSDGSTTPPRRGEDPGASTSDVKRVRALFEGSGSDTSSRKSSLGDESTSSGGTGRLYSKNPTSPTASSPTGGVTKRLKQFGGGQIQQTEQKTDQKQVVSKILRSAYSQFNLSNFGGGGVDFAELLVNDKVVIEESDSIHYLRNRKGQSKQDEQIQPSRAGCTTLRRSRSVGTGISTLGTDSSVVQSGLRTSRTCIIAEEMPAPDTVKNVRTVFEQILKMRNTNASSSSSSSSTSSIAGGSAKDSLMSSNAISIIKKSLSSVKSNPTSKIYRSESMKDNFQSACTSLQAPNRRFCRPLLHTESPPISPVPSYKAEESLLKNTSVVKQQIEMKNQHRVVERKYSEPIKFSPKINSPVRPQREDPPHPTLTEEDLSLLSSLNDSDSQAKFVSPDILQRIRSCGTTTTYFGGQIVAQTVKNRKMPLSRRHTTAASDFSAGFSSCTSSTVTTPTNFSRAHGDETVTSPSPTCSSSAPSRNSGFVGFEPETSSTPQPIPGPGLHRHSPMDIDSIFQGVTGLLSKGIDTTPRIISVLPKSPSASPTKSSSPVGSIIEGRGTPEGCEEGQDRCQWINEIPVNEEVNEASATLDKSVEDAPADGNNNDISNEKDVLGTDKKFSQVTEGAWF